MYCLLFFDSDYCFLFGVDYNAANDTVTVNMFEIGIHTCDETTNGTFGFCTEDRLLNTSHTNIGDIGCTLGQYLLVSGLNMGMRPKTPSTLPSR